MILSCQKTNTSKNINSGFYESLFKQYNDDSVIIVVQLFLNKDGEFSSNMSILMENVGYAAFTENVMHGKPQFQVGGNNGFWRQSKDTLILKISEKREVDKQMDRKDSIIISKVDEESEYLIRNTTEKSFEMLGYEYYSATWNVWHKK